MPGMSGWHVAEVIAARSTTPVVVITGSEGDGDRERARAQGIPMLQKPVKAPEIDLGEKVSR